MSSVDFNFYQMKHIPPLLNVHSRFQLLSDETYPSIVKLSDEISAFSKYSFKQFYPARVGSSGVINCAEIDFIADYQYFLCSNIYFFVWFIQGDFFHWHPPISLPKIKPPSSQSELLFQEILLQRNAVIGCLAVFFLVLKLGVPVIKITLYLNLKAASS